MRDVEFLPDWYPKVRQRRRTVALQAWITLVLAMGLGLWMLLVQRNVREREGELTTLRADLFQSETDLQRLDDLLDLQKPLRKQEDIFLRIGRPIETTRVVTTLERMMPRDMALLDLAMETEEAPRATGALSGRALKEAKQREAESRIRFRAHGVAPTDVALAEFLGKLQALPFFTKVELAYSHEREEEGRLMREFDVNFVMETSGAGGAR